MAKLKAGVAVNGLARLEHAGGADLLHDWRSGRNFVEPIRGIGYLLPSLACALGYERAALALIAARPRDTSVFTLVLAALRGLDSVVAKVAWHRSRLDGDFIMCPADNVFAPPVSVARQRIEDAVAASLRWRPGCAKARVGGRVCAPVAARVVLANSFRAMNAKSALEIVMHALGAGPACAGSRWSAGAARRPVSPSATPTPAQPA